MFQLKRNQVASAVNIGSEKALYAPVIYRFGNGARVYDVSTSNLVEIPILDGKAKVDHNSDYVPVNRCWFRFEDWEKDFTKFAADRFGEVGKYFKNNKPIAVSKNDYRPGFHVMYGDTSNPGRMYISNILTLNYGKIEAIRTVPSFRYSNDGLAVVINDREYTYDQKGIDDKVYPYLVWEDMFEDAMKSLIRDIKERWEHVNKIFDKATEAWAQGQPTSLMDISERIRREEKEQINAVPKAQMGCG